MKRYVTTILLGLGVLAPLAHAETADHAVVGTSGIKRAVGDAPVGPTNPAFDANARFLQIANSCLVGRPGAVPPPPAATGGAASTVPIDAGGLLEAQIPTGGLLGGAQGGSVGGGEARIPPSTSNGSALGAGTGDAARGMLLFNKREKGSNGCLSCHSAKAKSLDLLEGRASNPAMAGPLGKLSAQDRADLIAYLKSGK